MDLVLARDISVGTVRLPSLLDVDKIYGAYLESCAKVGLAYIRRIDVRTSHGAYLKKFRQLCPIVHMYLLLSVGTFSHRCVTCVGEPR